MRLTDLRLALPLVIAIASGPSAVAAVVIDLPPPPAAEAASPVSPAGGAEAPDPGRVALARYGGSRTAPRTTGFPYRDRVRSTWWPYGFGYRGYGFPFFFSGGRGVRVTFGGHRHLGFRPFRGARRSPGPPMRD